MNAQEALSNQIERISSLLKDTKPEDTKVPLGDWEWTYRQMRGIKAMWDTGGVVSWDIVEKEVGAEWIAVARNDKGFREYYSLRREADRLLVLLR